MRYVVRHSAQDPAPEELVGVLFYPVMAACVGPTVTAPGTALSAATSDPTVVTMVSATLQSKGSSSPDRY